MAKTIKPLDVYNFNGNVPPQVYGKGLDAYEVVCQLNGKMNEIIALVNDEMYELLNEYFNKIMIDCAYDEETETLILKKELATTGTTHVYNAGERSITIE